MKFDFELLRKNAFLKWAITFVATWKFFTFTLLAIPEIWATPIPITNRIFALAIGGLITWAFCYTALQFWKK